MLRWGVSALVIVLTGLALYGTSRLPAERRGAQGVVDEILAYEVTSQQDVAIELPSGLEHVVVGVWAVIEPRPEHDPLASYAFGIAVKLLDADGKPLGERRYAASSRVSTTGRGAADPFAARLAYEDGWVTDPRTIQVDTTPIAVRGGRLRLSAAGPGQRLLLRLSYAEPRTELASELLGRRLTAAERREIVLGRHSLGFADLTETARRRVLASWQRRLVAIGQSGKDYVQERLLLGAHRFEPARITPDPELLVELGPERAAALNALGPVAFELKANPGAAISVEEDGVVRQLRAADDGFVAITSDAPGARTLSVRAEHGLRALLTCKRGALEQLIGVPRLRPSENGDYQIAPDYRLHRYTRLDAEAPIVAHVANGQHTLGVTVRARAGQAVNAPVTLRWQHPSGKPGRAELMPELRPSHYDRFADGSAATEANVATFLIPAGAQKLELYGPDALAVALWTDEPRVESDVLEPPYRVALDDEQIWRSAGYELRGWAPILADNYADLERDGRVLELLTQARIERLGKPERPLPEQSLEPSAAPVRRELMLPAELAGGQFPDNGWTRLSGSRRLRITRAGARAGLLELVYRADREQLGRTLRLLVDGTSELEQQLVLTSGRLRAEVPPGVHEVAVEGLGSGGTAYAKAPPAAGRTIFRSYLVYELSKKSPIDLVVDQKPGQHSTLVVQVTTENGSRDWKLWYSIDGGSAALRSSGFYRRTTQRAGTLTGRGGSDGSGTLWELDRTLETPAALPDGTSRARIVLGDDLRPGRHTVSLRYQEPPPSILERDGAAAERVWVRVVRIGQAPDAGADRTRLWTVENLP